MEACALCSEHLGPVLGESRCWRIVLNRNQNLLGKCFLVNRRHVEPVVGLSTDEWAELHEEIKRVTKALTQAFRPDHFNYMFLQNQDRHVHLHVIPRYATPREFQGSLFEDHDYPAHYAVPGKVRSLSEVDMVTLGNIIRDRLRG